MLPKQFDYFHLVGGGQIFVYFNKGDEKAVIRHYLVEDRIRPGCGSIP
ncbi:hypothetical protein [Streptomyces sp. CRN 30]|nr:hypothetical protein [Streptomyces sp. CRN 30]